MKLGFMFKIISTTISLQIRLLTWSEKIKEWCTLYILIPNQRFWNQFMIIVNDIAILTKKTSSISNTVVETTGVWGIWISRSIKSYKKPRNKKDPWDL